MRPVLLLEPHDDTRELYTAALEIEGIGVRLVETTDEAIRLAQGADVIVTEVQVPGTLSGLGLVRLLRSVQVTRDIPIIVLSTSTSPLDMSAARAAGCDMFLAKPCLPEELCAAILSLQSRRITRPLSAAS